ncbi:hypothetical protein LQ954_03035 [Sphingomonas sp. IC-11]|uniref:hypothetical protein n=1 Tax=Sphingomonas sp. IC-11 TaxID=2898528 RepID=UPI001E4AEED4|nr:hypothetical protein [Sphingomonas sp. IC-11]MCD2315122.1 hypothetical protein [Sphingomonas sp. IC-11]
MAGTTGPRIDHYQWAGGRELMLRFGPEGPPCVIAALPLFEEGNRTRAAMVDVLRRLAKHGIASALPDLPGTGESLVDTEGATLQAWREAFAAACGQIAGPVHICAWRSGVLVDGEAAAASRWYLSPQSGEALIRELGRVRELSGGADLAGNLLSSEMLSALALAQPTVTGRLRVVRLDSDIKPADHKLAGRPLWRASEPDTDEQLQSLVADDLAAWVRAQSE